MSSAFEPDTAPGAVLQSRVFGGADAARTIVVLREGPAATTDPFPEQTLVSGARVIAIRLWPQEVVDPGAYGGETPATTTVDAIAASIAEHVGDAAVSVVGVGPAGAIGAQLVARLGARATHLVLVGVPRPPTPLERDLAAAMLARVTVPTLVAVGAEDEAATPADAAWQAALLGDATVLEVPRRPGSIDRRLGVADAWGAVLAFTGGVKGSRTPSTNG